VKLDDARPETVSDPAGEQRRGPRQERLRQSKQPRRTDGEGPDMLNERGLKTKTSARTGPEGLLVVAAIKNPAARLKSGGFLLAMGRQTDLGCFPRIETGGVRTWRQVL